MVENQKWSLRKALRRWRHDRVYRGKTVVNVVEEFSFFLPSSGGNYKMWEPLILRSISDLVPSLVRLCGVLGDNPKPISPEEFSRAIGVDPIVNGRLADLFNEFGSDKSDSHNYDIVYSAILHSRKQDKINVLEIGLGTNNVDVVSHMGKRGKPGASLRAFASFLPNSRVFGADVDSRVLFREERIETYYVDQLNPDSFLNLDKSLPSALDLMIDDGLHAPTANLNSLTYFLGKMTVGGYSIIEDIPDRALALWSVVGRLLPSNYAFWIVQARAGNMFVVRRLA